jgi:hypothetical protein
MHGAPAQVRMTEAASRASMGLRSADPEAAGLLEVSEGQQVRTESVVQASPNC